MSDKHEIDAMLNTRFMSEPSGNLADRIVHQASLQMRSGANTSTYFSRFKELFVLNYPALSSVACLVIGLYVGVLTESDTNASLNGLNEWLSFTSLDEEGYL